MENKSLNGSLGKGLLATTDRLGLSVAPSHRCRLIPELCDGSFGPDGKGTSMSRESAAGTQLSAT